jgi:hypothetical protein
MTVNNSSKNLQEENDQLRVDRKDGREQLIRCQRMRDRYEDFIYECGGRCKTLLHET